MKHLERVVVDDVGRCRSETKRQRFKILEYLAVRIVDRAMTFIDDHKVKEAWRKALCALTQVRMVCL